MTLLGRDIAIALVVVIVLVCVPWCFVIGMHLVTGN